MLLLDVAAVSLLRCAPPRCAPPQMGGHNMLLLDVAAVSLLRCAPPRCAPPQMGGFEQRRPMGAGARLGLLVKGDGSVMEKLPLVCRGQPSLDQPTGVRGVIYELAEGKAEVVAEGEREALELLAESVAGLGAVEVREAWQHPLPKTGYTDFPLVPLAPTMRAHIRLSGTPAALDAISRQLQVEAVFNRGLKLQKERPRPDLLDVTSQGRLDRLKSFARWCYVGPPLAQAESVRVTWEEVE